MSDYTSVSAIFVRALPNSLILRSSDGEEHAIGRSCIHGADERAADSWAEEQEVQIRVLAWLVDKENL